jgi:hypothetical protein
MPVKDIHHFKSYMADTQIWRICCIHLDRTKIQTSLDDNKTPPTRTPPTSPSRPRRRRTFPTSQALLRSPAAGPTGARTCPRTCKQTSKDGDKLGKLHDQPYPQEQKKYERKKK